MEPVILGGFPTARTTQHNRGPLSQCPRKLDLRRADRFARGYRGELREPIEHLRFFLFEIAQGIEVWNFSRVREPQGIRARPRSEDEWRSGSADEAGPQIRVRFPEGGNRTDAGDHDAMRHWADFAASALAAKSFSMPSTMSRIVRMLTRRVVWNIRDRFSVSEIRSRE